MLEHMIERRAFDMEDMRLTGKDEGIAEGKKKQQHEIAKKMINKGMDLSSIFELTGLSIEEIKKL